ncbi:lipase family protein [Corynebacterium nuruki]|uniref:lipase family protein n=1 Tax=Corynebacterium nuruki TaxID=1032851 RepID=UPI002357266F|nr:lipase family protein [Corynebacterium nuruki]
MEITSPWRRTLAAALLVPALVVTGTGTAVAGAPADPTVPAAEDAAAPGIPVVDDDASFFALPDAATLADLAPGTPLKQRDVVARVSGLETPATMTQIQYRSTTVTGEPTVAVTSVLHPTGAAAPTGDTVMYASFYDSMDPEDGPSRLLARGTQTELLDKAEAGFVAPALMAGHSVVMPDIQGERGIFAVGKEYAHIILDSLRAAHRTPAAAVDETSPTVFAGYSGGSIGAGWSAITADDYAPEIAEHVIGVAQGGTMVRPEHNLAYAGEGPKWSGVVGMALAGMARAYGDDLTPYLTDFGRGVVDHMAGIAIGDAENLYPHLRWDELFRPDYPTPDDVPAIRRVLDDTNMGLAASPSYPQLIVQAGGGEQQQKTPPHPTLGDGDGVMLLGDTRALAAKYCGDGVPVQYVEPGPVGHTIGAVAWFGMALQWVNDRFAGAAAPSTCGDVPPGNSLTD